MVCSIESWKMTALPRRLDAGSVPQIVTGEGGQQKLASQYLRRQLHEADEANLVDEEDMHIFGLRSMTDPLDLVCCNACKKPIKASQYATHAELCKSLSSREDVRVELASPIVNKKPPRKERKKSMNTQTKKAASLRAAKNFKPAESEDITLSHSCLGNVSVTSTPKIDGLRASAWKMDCYEDATKCSLKPHKRTATECLQNPGTKIASGTLSYVPAPLATKIYYSQKNCHLRRAICRMFFEESSKESSSEVSNLDALQVNAAPTHTSTPSNVCYEQVDHHQNDDHCLHPAAPTSEQIHSAHPDLYMGKSGGFVSSATFGSQLPMNNTLEPHYLSNSYSFAGKPGNPHTVEQGCESVQVV